VAASRPPPASISSEPAAKGTSAPVEGGAITEVPRLGVATELLAEVPRTPLAGAAAGVLVGTLVGVGIGVELATATGVVVAAAVEVVLVWVDFVVVWLDEVVWAVWVDVVDLVVVEVAVGVVLAADTTCNGDVPESSMPAGP
ncbi:MAG: hypothetical protein ACREQ5_33470, partial [Candidatus Dormibacteria bacterium]